MKYIFIVLAILASGLVWTRILATPLYGFLGRFVEDRITRLIMSGVILVALLSCLALFPATSEPSRTTVAENMLSSLLITIPCATLWIVLEYRYGGSYRDQRKRFTSTKENKKE